MQKKPKVLTTPAGCFAKRIEAQSKTHQSESEASEGLAKTHESESKVSEVQSEAAGCESEADESLSKAEGRPYKGIRWIIQTRRKKAQKGISINETAD